LGHTSSTTALGLEIGNNDAEDDSTGELWQVYYEGIQYIAGGWTAGIRYRENDLVKYGGSILRCTVGHVAASNYNKCKFCNRISRTEFLSRMEQILFTMPLAMLFAMADIFTQQIQITINSNPASEDTTNGILSKAINFQVLGLRCKL
jgi:hypothetical protein